MTTEDPDAGVNPRITDRVESIDQQPLQSFVRKVVTHERANLSEGKDKFEYKKTYLTAAESALAGIDNVENGGAEDAE